MLVDGVFDYALYMLDLAGNVISWNAGAERIKGYRAEEIVGRHFSLFYTPGDRDCGAPEETLRRARDLGGYAEEVRRVRKDGSVFWADVVVDPMRSEDGELIGFAKITRDISQRKEAAERLLASERSLRFLVNGLTDYGLCLLDPDGIITTWNLGAERLRGYTTSEIIGQHFEIFFSESDKASGAASNLLSVARATGRFEGRRRTCRKNGDMFWTHLTIEAVFDEKQQHVGFAALTRDITDQKRAEDSQQMLSALFEEGPEAIALVDEARSIIRVNQRFADLFGYRPEELAAREIDLLWEPDIRSRLIDYMNDAVIDGYAAAPTSFQPVGIRKDGEAFPCEVRTSPLRRAEQTLLIVTARDITQRLVAEAILAENRREQATLEERARNADQLRRTSETLSKLIEASPVGIFGFNDGHIFILNTAAKNIFGLGSADSTELEQRLNDDFKPVDGISRHQLRTMVREKGTIRDIGVRRRARDGKYIDLNISGAMLSEGEGYVLFVDDVTRRKAVDAQLAQAQKMEAISQLTGGVAHDFNNLLAIIHGNMELLQESVPDSPEMAELVSDALNASKRGASLTQRLLAYSRQQQLAPSLIDPGALLRDSFSVMMRVLEESIEISTQIDPDLWPLHVDANQLESALLNLVVNARDAMPQGGRLVISAKNETLDDDYVVDFPEIAAGHYVLLAVSDTGTGMSPNVAQRALEPFFTTKPIGKGAGLGLSMVYGFVKQSGGHLKIYSEENIGTTIRIYLPRVADGQIERREAPTPPPPLPKPSGSILVVEDEEAVRRLILRILAVFGYRALEAGDGPTALGVLQQNPDVELLITDLVMPGGLNGAALYREARKLSPGLKAVFISGYASQVIVRDIDIEGSPLLSKPFTRAQLSVAISKALMNSIGT